MYHIQQEYRSKRPNIRIKYYILADIRVNRHLDGGKSHLTSKLMVQCRIKKKKKKGRNNVKIQFLLSYRITTCGTETSY